MVGNYFGGYPWNYPYLQPWACPYCAPRCPCCGRLLAAPAPYYYPWFSGAGVWLTTATNTPAQPQGLSGGSVEITYNDGASLSCLNEKQVEEALGRIDASRM